MFASSRSRRHFIKTLGIATPSLALLSSARAQAPLTASLPTAGASKTTAKPRELKADLVVIGGGLGGCAAALAAARNGLRVIVTEETDWIGGQLTSQAVPPDENAWIESFGGTRSYLQLRRKIREFYYRNYPLTAEARAHPYLNPGYGWVSRLCCEPRAGLAALQEMLAPHQSSQRIQILLQHVATAAETDGDAVKAVEVQSLATGDRLVLRAPYFIDATEMGDLLPLTKTEYVSGAEARKDTGEPNAAEVANPANLQGFTCCFAADYIKGENHVIDKPAQYSFWRDYEPKMKPAWPGKLLSWFYGDPTTPTPKKLETDPERALGLWTYRRILDRSLFMPGAFQGDISLINWPQNDYFRGNLYGGTEQEAKQHLEAGKQLSLSLLYWLQTEAPRPDGGTGWPGLRLRPDVVGTIDGLAKYPYIRESRRIQAQFTVLEQHISTEYRMKETGATRENVTAVQFNDTVGIGSYRIDLHPSTAGDGSIDVSSLPFQIPLGSLLPKRVRNLLPGCKNLGVTHITNGCYRVHSVEWNIGETAGALAAFCINRKREPFEVRANANVLGEFQGMIAEQGVPLSWPKVFPL
jgi:hypothetical protein